LFFYFEISIVDMKQLILGPSGLAVGCALMILGGIRLKMLSLPFFKMLAWPGQLSYGAYLWHITVLFLIWPYLAWFGCIWDFPIFLLCVGILSYVSYRWFEKPANRLTRQLLNPSNFKNHP